MQVEAVKVMDREFIQGSCALAQGIHNFVFPINPEENEGRGIGVELLSLYGMEAKFQCAECEVTDVRPFEPSA